MIPTDAPAWAALRAARWPARPAPITRTSCSGTGFGFYANGCQAPGVLWSPHPGDTLLERPSDLVPGHDPEQPPVGIHGHQRAHPHDRLVVHHVRDPHALDLGEHGGL